MKYSIFQNIEKSSKSQKIQQNIINWQNEMFKFLLWVKIEEKYYLCSHHSLSFCNQRTLRTKTFSITTLSFVSPQPRNQTMIPTPSTLRSPLFQLTFCLFILHFFTLSTQHNHSLTMIHRFIHFNLSNIPILLIQKINLSD